MTSSSAVAGSRLIGGEVIERSPPPRIHTAEALGCRIPCGVSYHDSYCSDPLHKRRAARAWR